MNMQIFERVISHVMGSARAHVHLIYTSQFRNSAYAARPAGYVWVYESKRTSTEFGSGARFDGLISDF